MSLMTEADRARVRELLGGVVSPVRLHFFTQTLECESCPETRAILAELAGLSDRLSIEEHNYLLDAEAVAAYRIARVPAIALAAGSDTGIRFYGAPSGYEFMSLLDAILLVGRGDSGLSAASRARLAQVSGPVDIQVFVTPT